MFRIVIEGDMTSERANALADLIEQTIPGALASVEEY